MRFGVWELDVGRRTLFREGEPVHLSPKAFQLLQVLSERAPNAVSKDDLHTLIWPDTFVTETNLAGIVAEVRAALGDDARKPRVLRTVHGFGYAFAAEVQDAPKARYRVIVRGVEISLAAGENLIGRKPEASIFIDDASVSREHARIAVGDGATIEDLGSKNGTFLNGRRVSAPEPLRNRDVIGAGTVTFTFHDTAVAESTVTIHQES
ncbi:MAG TPA: FHA domain-containing protein [Thermoanaerobaculia bacterium]|jgi:DNA-binding winged helix-turn-helix (wHTH) protein